MYEDLSFFVLYNRPLYFIIQPVHLSDISVSPTGRNDVRQNRVLVTFYYFYVPFQIFSERIENNLCSSRFLCSCRDFCGSGSDSKLPGIIWTLVLQHQRDLRCRETEGERWQWTHRRVHVSINLVFTLSAMFQRHMTSMPTTKIFSVLRCILVNSPRQKEVFSNVSNSTWTHHNSCLCLCPQSALVFWLDKGVDGVLLSGVERVASVVPSQWTDIRAIVQNRTDERLNKRSGPEHQQNKPLKCILTKMQKNQQTDYENPEFKFWSQQTDQFFCSAETLRRARSPKFSCHVSIENIWLWFKMRIFKKSSPVGFVLQHQEAAHHQTKADASMIVINGFFHTQEAKQQISRSLHSTERQNWRFFTFCW